MLRVLSQPLSNALLQSPVCLDLRDLLLCEWGKLAHLQPALNRKALICKTRQSLGQQVERSVRLFQEVKTLGKRQPSALQG